MSLNKLRANVASTKAKRIGAHSFAEELLPAVREARSALLMDGRETVSDSALARYMNDVLGVRSITGRVFGPEMVRQNLYEMELKVTEHAVIECRTRMFLISKRAFMSNEEADELEAEYIDMIADALALGRALRGEPPKGRDALLRDARINATAMALEQRARARIPIGARDALYSKAGPPLEAFAANRPPNGKKR